MNAVEIQGVSQRYGSMTVLHDLNLTLAEGEVLGLFGHNGAGKTTSMKLILGLLAPSEGQVKVLGRAPNDPQVAPPGNEHVGQDLFRARGDQQAIRLAPWIARLPCLR